MLLYYFVSMWLDTSFINCGFSGWLAKNLEFQTYLTAIVQHIVEPKSNAVDHGTDTLRDRSLRLYQNSPGLWKYTFKHGRKSAVEQIFGEIKVTIYGLNSRKRGLLKKQILLQFLVYNLDKAVELENWGWLQFLNKELIDELKLLSSEK